MKTFLDFSKTTFAQNETITVPVYLHTQGIVVNAVDGVITFPANLFELQEIQDGNSAINFWVEQPKVVDGTISFSGMTPGGFYGDNQLITTLVLRSKTVPGTGDVVTAFRAYQNDGNGTPALVTDTRYSVVITDQVVDTSLAEASDRVPPESFQPIIGRDPNLFDGNYFVAFSTQDKGVGIDRYQVREGFFTRYHDATSPMMLADQSLRTKIFIKAIDHAGNERVEKISGTISTTSYIFFGFVAIIVISSIILLIYKKVWRKSIR